MDDMNKKSRKRAKKKLLIIILSIVVLMTVLLIAVYIIDLVNNKKSRDFEIDYNFYPANYEENIFDNSKYLELISDEFIKYRDSSTNITLGINKDTAKNYGDEIKFLVDMLYDIIDGDHESYNERFSSDYYKTNTPKERFTMQMIYDVTITSVSSESVSDKSANYTKSVYCVEYKIYHNNGTFRRDIGDGSKKQYITISNKSGEILIDSVSTVIIANKKADS